MGVEPRAIAENGSRAGRRRRPAAVKHDDVVAGRHQLCHHVRSDESGPADQQHPHAKLSIRLCAMSKITLNVNGRAHAVDVEPSVPLLYVLRNDLGLQGPHFGCGLGQCGACTVLIKGEAVRSCVRSVSSAQGLEITTLEGLAQNGRLHPLQQAWIDEQVPQCGFCQNGQILTAKAMLDRNPRPTDADIRNAMQNTICRCMTYYRIQAAIKRAAKEMAS
jgi:aerobic-type carbon monoxide dehydrogenase small subunit (CoxS/CutS family)